MLLTGTSDVAVNIKGYYNKVLLVRSVPELLHGLYGDVRPLPPNSGTRTNFRSYDPLAVATTPLNEGSPGSGKKAATSDIYTTISQYGDFILYSDLVSMTAPDAVLTEFKELLAEQMGQTIDIITRDEMVTGTNVRYANGVAGRTTVATAISDDDVNVAIRTLESTNSKKVKRMVVPGMKVGTRPIAPAYVAISHTDCRQDIEDTTGFTRVEEYASLGDRLPGEIGAKGNVRFTLSTNGKIWQAGGIAVGTTNLVADDSTNVDVYATIIIAEHAYATIPLNKLTVKSIIKKLGYKDELDMVGSCGWKAAYAAKITNEDNMVRIEHGVTDL